MPDLPDQLFLTAGYFEKIDLMPGAIKKSIKKKEGFQGQRVIVIPRTVLASNCSKDALLRSMHITDMGYYPKARFHYRQRTEGADQHILIYCVRGKGKVVVKRKHYSIEPGNFIIIPRLIQHRYAADELDPWTIYWVHFTGTTSDSLIEYIRALSGDIKGFINYEQQQVDMFNRIYAELERGYGIENMVYANLCFHYYLATYMRPDSVSEKNSSTESDVVNLVINFMKLNIGSVTTLQQMAKEVNLSPSHLSFLFKKKTGYPPVEYFNHLKVQQACQYLLFTNLRIKEIADLLGIDDPYYFSRFFKKLMGVSPNMYRERKNQ